jgi:hypothetical protein
MTRFPKASVLAEPHGKTDRELALQRSDRVDSVFATLIEVFEETEASSLEYSEDLLCDLVRACAPDVTTVRKLTTRSRAVARTDFSLAITNGPEPPRTTAAH